MNSDKLRKQGHPLLAILVLVAALATTGCPEKRDPLAEHLLQQRNKAVKQLEQRAQSDKSLDILCWDITNVVSQPAAIQRWAFNQKDLDVLALSGPDLAKLQLAARMEDKLDALERGWPIVASTNRDQATDPSTVKQHSVINANGYRFEGIVSDPIKDWEPTAQTPGRTDPPPTLHLQVKYIGLEVMLVYLTNTQTVSDLQMAAVSKWIEVQSMPVVVFGEFDANKLTSSSLMPIKSGRVAASKSLETWQLHVEEIESPLGKDGPQPMIIRCKEMR